MLKRTKMTATKEFKDVSFSAPPSVTPDDIPSVAPVKGSQGCRLDKQPQNVNLNLRLNPGTCTAVEISRIGDAYDRRPTQYLFETPEYAMPATWRGALHVTFPLHNGAGLVYLP